MQQQNSSAGSRQQVRFLTEGKNMKASITKRLCLSAALFGMAVTSVSAQQPMDSTLMDNDQICANSSAVYPNAVTAGQADFEIPSQSVERLFQGGGSTMVQVLGNGYKSLGADKDVSIVDWVQIELRVADKDAPAPARIGVPNIDDATVARIAGLLLTNGQVVDPDQPFPADDSAAGEPVVEGISFEPPENLDMAAQDVYVIVNHRNHLSIMSAQAQNNAIENELLIDFSSSIRTIVGGAAAVKEVTVGGQVAYAMLAGDANVNGQVQPTDGANIVAPNSGRAGYHNADVDMNFQIQPTDIANTLTPNSGGGTQFDTNFSVDSRLISITEASQPDEVVCWTSG